ncbi:hypothetical protein [Jongsikchunia kroppenstedtii]|uniref:hypothetical protein n=1 Tax=Jongsikchunia kroppenstedtii TaxID=1121721 RepID=UPI00037B5D86|nr:hypothetical protein [Jongsikchunia kroppenstedtii]
MPNVRVWPKAVEAGDVIDHDGVEVTVESVVVNTATVTYVCHTNDGDEVEFDWDLDDWVGVRRDER